MPTSKLLGMLTLGLLIGGVAACMQTGSLVPLIVVVVVIGLLFRIAGYGPRN